MISRCESGRCVTVLPFPPRGTPEWTKAAQAVVGFQAAIRPPSHPGQLADQIAHLAGAFRLYGSGCLEGPCRISWARVGPSLVVLTEP